MISGMLTLLCPEKRPLPPQVAIKEFHEMRITAVALAMIALLCASIGTLAMGLSTFPPTFNVGFGFLPAFLGALFYFSAIAFTGMAAMASAAAIYRYNRLKS